MNDRGRLRLVVVRVLVLSLVATLFWRLWYLQVLTGNSYAAAAKRNEVRQIVTPAPRGLILDDMGRPLVRNTTDLVVSVSAHTLALQRDGGAAVLGRLSHTLALPVAELQRRMKTYNGSPYQPIPVAAFSSTDLAAARKGLAIQEQGNLFPGVSVALQAVRQYPYGSLASHELGYLAPINSQELKQKRYQGYSNTELIGATGLEYQYQQYLRGKPGVQSVTVDHLGNVTGTVNTTPPTPGNDLVLNLDAGVQESLDKALELGIAKAKAQGGFLASSAAGVVMNVRTGAVIAMGSVPSYDPSQFTGGISNAAYAALNSSAAGVPLLSRAYQSAFPPGSTFKAISASAILADHIDGATPATLTPCPGVLMLGTFPAHNFQYESTPGPISFAHAIQISCDTVFYKYAFDAWLQDGGLRQTPAEQAMPDRQLFAKMALAYGLGKPTGIDLPGETPGLIGTRQTHLAYWKANRAQECIGAHTHPTNPIREKLDAYNCKYGFQYQGGQAAQFAIGQGSDVLLSPLQLATVYAAVANGGTLVTPRLAKAVISPTGGVVKKFGPVSRGHVPVSAADLAYLRQGFRDVVSQATGTGSGAGFPPSLDVAGKTGTADNSVPGQPISWFSSFQPASAPKYVVVIMVDHAGQGALAAAPAVVAVYNHIYGVGTPAVLPGGTEPASLPTITATGIHAPLAHPIPVAAEPPLPGGTPAPAGALVPPVLPAVSAALLLFERRRRRRARGRGRQRGRAGPRGWWPRLLAAVGRWTGRAGP